MFNILKEKKKQMQIVQYLPWEGGERERERNRERERERQSEAVEIQEMSNK